MSAKQAEITRSSSKYAIMPALLRWQLPTVIEGFMAATSDRLAKTRRTEQKNLTFGPSMVASHGFCHAFP